MRHRVDDRRVEGLVALDRPAELLEDRLREVLALGVLAEDVGPVDVGAGVLEIVNTQMNDLLRTMVASKGYDTHDFTLLYYGGAGPVHVVEVARKLNIPRVLATIAEHKPANFYHFMLDNECYATTGGQPVPNAGRVHYDKLALGAGYPEAHAFDNLETFSINVERILSKPGPVFVALKINPEIINVPIGSRRKWNARSPSQCIIDMKKEIGIAS